MTQYYGVFILLATSLLSFSIAANEKEITMNNENSNVLEAVQAMTSAFHNKDIDGVLTSYEDGAAVMFEPGTKVSDPAVLRQMFEGAFQLNPKFSYPKGHEVYTSNDIALHIAPWTMAGQAPDGTDVNQSGLSIAVLRKNENGKWRLVLDNPHGQLLMGSN
jgi:ketosteroid isomerase-like protein